MECFNIKIEFNHEVFRNKIEDSRGKKGYVCVVDANVLTMTWKDVAYCKIVRESYMNTCDGSSIAAMINHIYGTNYRAFTGPDIFKEYIGKSSFTQLLLGNTEEKYRQIKSKLEAEGNTSSHLHYMSVPFVGIDDFDYISIAESINKISPDIVWVSLGAPKQEIFMSRLLSHVNQGLMFGIGAAFNFYVGDVSQSNMKLGAIRFTWLGRIFHEPRKQLKRVFTILKFYPSIYCDEKKRYKGITKQS